VHQFKFYIATGGKYRGRLIIPFTNRNGKLFYFQARALGDEQPKYLNCKNLKSSQVLYPFDYGSQEPLYITEGVFDCLSLQAVGLNATTTLSCFTSREQMLQLSQYTGP
jgi:DNA primase